MLSSLSRRGADIDTASLYHERDGPKTLARANAIVADAVVESKARVVMIA